MIPAGVHHARASLVTRATTPRGPGSHFEKTRRLKKDVHVSDHPTENEKGGRRR